MSKKWKLIGLNALLAGLAAFSGALMGVAELDVALLIAAIYAGGRAVVGYIVSALSELRDVSDLALK